MYYKVMQNNRVVDVLDRLIFLKNCKKHNIMVHCDVNEAQAILSSDQNTIWHVDTLYQAPKEYDTVSLVEITKTEYEQLKALNGKTPQEIIDAYTLTLLESGLL
mgnify:FL=1